MKLKTIPKESVWDRYLDEQRNDGSKSTFLEYCKKNFSINIERHLIFKDERVIKKFDEENWKNKCINSLYF